ncbi:MAG TPA: hypothetical protein DDW90_10330 [Cyanobacteria bacterium UBA9971]|nr:hypothetical protein [Cyanobacteria bacterium UBA9971]
MFIEQISGQKIKIKFDINEKQLLLGDILKITASGKNGVLVQVTGISTAEKNPNFNIADSKILYTLDNTGKLINWQGNIPSQDFLINKLSAKEVLLCSNTLNAQNPIPVGILSLYPDTEVNLEASFFERPTVIYCDKQTQKDNILSLLSCELSKTAGKTVLIDFDNSYSDLKVSLIMEAGKNIKLPFDLKGLELLYKKSLSDASAETRATVEDIFMEVENYLSSGEIENIPFSSFRQAVDSVYATNKLTELVLLKNKLSKLEKNGVFADKKQEITNFSENIKTNNLVIVDLSKFPSDWQKDLIEFLIDSNTKKYKQKFFLLVAADKAGIDKAFIENLCTKANKNGVCPVIITGHESETAVSLLSYAANIIAFAPENTTKITALQESLIRLKDNEVVITGRITNNIPLYTNIYDTEVFEESHYSTDLASSSPEIYLNTEYEAETEDELPTTNSFSYEMTDEIEEEDDEENFNYSNQFDYDESGIELVENISKLQEEVHISQKETAEADEYSVVSEDSYEEDEDIELEQDDSYEEDDSFELEQNDPYEANSNNSSFYDEETEDEADSEEDEEDEEPEENSYNINSNSSSFYDANENENIYNSSKHEPSEPPKKYASGFSEEDLSSFLDDDIDDNQLSYSSKDEHVDEDFDYSSNEEFQDESVLDYGSFYDDSDEEENNSNLTDEYDEENAYEEPAKPSKKTKSAKPSMPDIPIYSTPKNQTEASYDDDFQEGDKVKHEKYGLGTVTKIIGSNEKRLCSIQFDDVGRRLLDPKLSELEKI